MNMLIKIMSCGISLLLSTAAVIAQKKDAPTHPAGVFADSIRQLSLKPGVNANQANDSLKFGKSTYPALLQLQGITSTGEGLFLRPESLKNLKYINADKAIKLYGKKAKGGVIVLEPKDGIVLLNLQQILKAFPQKEYGNTSKVYVNDTPVANKSEILVEKAAIQSVSILHVGSGTHLKIVAK